MNASCFRFEGPTVKTQVVQVQQEGALALDAGAK